MDSTFQSQYQVSYNEVDLYNQIKSARPNRGKQTRDTFSFEKKSLLNTYDPYSSFSSASNNEFQGINSRRPETGRQLPNSLLDVNKNSVYNQHYNYIGAEPHLSERIKSIDGAFGPNNQELSQAFKSNASFNIEQQNSASYMPPKSVKNERTASAYNHINSNLVIIPNLNDRPGRNETPKVGPYPDSASAYGKAPQHNAHFNGMDERPTIRSHDFRPVWIPKKYPGRNMFYSHLDSSIFPGKYEVADQVWNSLSNTNSESKMSYNMGSKQETLSATKTASAPKRVPSFTHNSSYIIHSLDKSILPVIKTDNLKAAQLAKTRQYSTPYLYQD